MGFQVIPLVMLGAYILYASYYYATPMFFLKVMLFFAHIKYRDIDIRFEERRITVRFTKDGEEHVVSRPVDEELESRSPGGRRAGIQVLAYDGLFRIPPPSQGYQKRQTVRF